MCGRYGCEARADELSAFIGTGLPGFGPPLPELRPTDLAPVVHLDEGNRLTLRPMRWGFTPSWQKSTKPLINARAETVHEKPSFRDSFARRRCIVPATSFFEWQRLSNQRIPHKISLQSGGLFAMAGIWQPAPTDGSASASQFCILTTEPNELIRPIHDRMPVILKHRDLTDWLSPSAHIDALRAMLAPADPAAITLSAIEPKMSAHPGISQLSLF